MMSAGRSEALQTAHEQPPLSLQAWQAAPLLLQLCSEFQNAQKMGSSCRQSSPCLIRNTLGSLEGHTTQQSIIKEKGIQPLNTNAFWPSPKRLLHCQQFRY